MLSVPMTLRLTEAVMAKGDIRRGYAGSAAGIGRAIAIRGYGLSRLSEALSRFKQQLLPKCRKRVYSTECFKKHSVFFVSGIPERPGQQRSAFNVLLACLLYKEAL